VTADAALREDTVVGELAAVEEEALLVVRDALLVLDLGLEGGDRVNRVEVDRDLLAGECCCDARGREERQ